MRTVLGKVTGLTGMAEIVDAHGQHVLLKAGDSLHDGDQLVTAAGCRLAMQTPDGEMMQFAEQQTIRLSDVLLASSSMMDMSEQAVNPAVVQHVLATLQLDDVVELSPPLASILQEDPAAFVSIMHPSVSECLWPGNGQEEALNIHDVLVSSDSQTVLPSQGMTVGEVADLLTQTSASVDIGLPQSPLKDFLNE